MESKSGLRPDARQYSNSREYLQDTFSYKKDINPGFSTRAWARRMGYKNHSLLSLFLQGKRAVKPRHLRNLLRGLDLNIDEKQYFEALVRLDAAETDLERDFFEAQLRLLSHNNTLTFIDVEKFRVISRWFHFAILEMTELKDFQASPKWIAERLGNRITTSEVEAAIERLIQLGLLAHDGERLVKTKNRFHVGDGKAHTAIREYHRQVLRLAEEALDNQTTEERNFHSFSFTIDTQKLPDAEKLIQKFRRDLAKLCGKSGGNETYQSNIQLFRLTKTTRGERK